MENMKLTDIKGPWINEGPNESFKDPKRISGDSGLELESADECACKVDEYGNKMADEGNKMTDCGIKMAGNGNKMANNGNKMADIENKNLARTRDSINADVRINKDLCFSTESLHKWCVSKLKQRNDAANGNMQALRNSLHWEEFFGSSIDLAPTLLGIYDRIASSSRNEDPDDDSKSNFFYFTTNENLEDGSDDQCHSPESSPPVEKKFNSHRYQKKDLSVQQSKGDNVDSGDCNANKIKLDMAENKHLAELDNKKRPLSISSMSSSSTSSLPRRRKRPNLSQYTSASQLDIEKLDNILYIDDAPETEIREGSADEFSLCSDDKQKSGGDSDSQISAEQAEMLQTSSASFHQSDSSLSFVPNNSANNSTIDLESIDPRDDRVKRSSSRSSTKSGSVPRSPSQKGHYVSYVQRVVTELVETEGLYVLNLQDIKQGYFEYLTSCAPFGLSTLEMKCLFGNIEQIYDFSCGFLAELQACGLDPVKMAECFVKNNAGFAIYANYCTNYPSAVGVLTRVMRDSQLSEVFKQRQLILKHSLPLGAYLLKPVQRVLKYHLLLQNILKHYSKDDNGYEKLVTAHDHMTQMSHHINEMKRKHEHAVRVQEIQSQLEEYDGEDFTRLGELVLEGSFRLFGVKASRLVFLFEKGVIIAKRKEDGMLGCKAYIPCATLMLVESIPKEPLNFQILPFDNPRGAHTIHARNLEQKRKWCQEIKRLILESYSSKIPDSVKDLVIEKLGKSKEEDALLETGTADTGKSHVSTPEYLEKRLRARRKSGTALLQEILRPPRTKRFPGKSRAETAIAKPGVIDNITYDKEDMENFGLRHKLLAFGKGDRSGQSESQENRSPRKNKRPLSLQRSQSFQSGKTNIPQKYRNEQSTMDAISMDNLLKSDSPVIRTNSFRMATNLSPIKMEMPEMGEHATNNSPSSEPVPNGVLRVQKNLDNIPDSVRKSIENIESPKQLSLTPKEVLLNAADNMTGGYLEETSLGKKGRYASMPLLNTTPPSSPKIQRLHSDRVTGSPMLNQKLPVHYAKRIDTKPYFSYSRDRLNETSMPISAVKGGNTLNKNEKHVNAFHDTFSSLKKPEENELDKNDKSLGPKPLTLTQPKPFTSSLRNSVQLLSSHARLNKCGPEKFTKGSMSDLSHLKEDPWIRNKHRSYTESRVTLDNHRSPLKDRRTGNKFGGALTLDRNDSHHRRTYSVDGQNEFADNLDWVVYANRNSIPVSALSIEDINRFKYCTPPRGAMEPPPADPRYSNGSLLSSYHGDNTGDSSISLSANTTSSETCSSPEILKEFVFDELSSAEKMYLRDRAHVSRSFSTPMSEQNIKAKRQLQEDRPTSADILGDVSQLEESEKLVEEMERYMKRSTSSSGSLSSTNNRFPTNIPMFDHRHESKGQKNHPNRHSCISNGSASSYESTGDLSAENKEGIAHKVKSKISTITSKITKKKGHVSDSDSSPSSPMYTQDDRPQRLSHFSFRSKPGMAKSPERDLPTILRQSEPGSQAIGSRMANADFDDYATFSLPRVHETREKLKVKETKSAPNLEKPNVPSKKHVQYGKYSSSNLTAGKPTGARVPAQAQSETKLCPPVPTLKTYQGTQSDSAFSIQSVDIDSSIPEDSHRDGQKNTEADDNLKQDNFYERRFSAVFNSDEAFRDSAVYCDDIETGSVHHAVPIDKPLSPKPNIRNYVQQFEEKSKPKVSNVMKVKHKEPGAIIKQRIESLAANSEYKAKSAGPSRTLSTVSSQATSRANSRCNSRASSEDKMLSSYMLKEYIESKFPTNPSKHETEDDSVFHRGHVNHYGTLKHAMSMGRLDSLKNDVDNLVIMKGWVKELIDKFQHTKK